MCVGRQMFIRVMPRVPECCVGSVPQVSHGILDKAFCLFLSSSCFIVKVMPPEFLTDVPKLFH